VACAKSIDLFDLIVAYSFASVCFSIGLIFPSFVSASNELCVALALLCAALAAEAAALAALFAVVADA